MLKVSGLTKKIGLKQVLGGVSFEIEGNGVFGLLGPNGAGKSTTMNIITGCLASDEGTVTVGGYDIYEEPIKAKRLIGYLPENPPLYSDMSVFEYLKFIAKAKGVKKSDMEEEFLYALEKTGLKNELHTRISNLSKGYKQRVGIAQALIGSPAIIILDEPTVGLDPRQIIEIRDLITELGKEHCVIFSSHILNEVQELCERVIIISEGSIVADDTIENLCSLGDEHPTLTLTVKTDPMTAMDIIDEYEEISHYAITECEDGTELVLTLIQNADIRERLFFEFSGKGIVILGMHQYKQSLEESYMKMTEPLYQRSEDDLPAESITDAAVEEQQYNETEQNEDDYTPLFGGKEDE